jgi:hypothetical protein
MFKRHWLIQFSMMLILAAILHVGATPMTPTVNMVQSTAATGVNADKTGHGARWPYIARKSALQLFWHHRR